MYMTFLALSLQPGHAQAWKCDLHQMEGMHPFMPLLSQLKMMTCRSCYLLEGRRELNNSA
eukprot:1158324-Pelagomonas_calceolata.AAC.5